MLECVKDVIFIFEDNPEMLTSKLLTECSYNHENIYFAKSNGQLFSKLKQLYDTTHVFCIFYDYALENSSLVNGYRQLYRKIRNLEGYNNNALLVPIPCMEYLILRMLVDYNYVRTDELLNKAIISFDYDYIRRNYPNFVSLEKFFKIILNHFLTSEYHNVNALKNDTFPEAACASGNFYRNGNQGKKAEQLYSEFPLFEVISAEHNYLLNKYGIAIKAVALEGICSDINPFYESIYKWLHKDDDHYGFRLLVAPEDVLLQSKLIFSVLNNDGNGQVTNATIQSSSVFR